MSLTWKQEEVFHVAYERLKSKKWFRGICTDDFPTDEEIDRDGKEAAVNAVIMHTEYWDNW